MEKINIKTTDHVMGGGKTTPLQLRAVSYHCDDAHCGSSLCGELWIDGSNGRRSYVFQIPLPLYLRYVGKDWNQLFCVDYWLLYVSLQYHFEKVLETLS